MERHLAALEAALVAVAGPRFLSLVAAAGSLAVAAARTASHPLAGARRPAGRRELMEPHGRRPGTLRLRLGRSRRRDRFGRLRGCGLPPPDRRTGRLFRGGRRPTRGGRFLLRLFLFDHVALGSRSSALRARSVAFDEDLDQVPDLADASSERRSVLALDDLADPAESERPDRRLLVDRCRDPALRQAQAQRRRSLGLAGARLLRPRFGSRRRIAHASTPAAAASGCEPAPPRLFRISSAFFNRVSPSNVALMTLCGFVVRRDFVRMSWIPTDSSTARTGPPAMTPVPGAAGFNSTRPAP